MKTVVATMPSPLGEITIVGSDAGLHAVALPGWSAPMPADAEEGDHPVLTATMGQLRAYFEGHQFAFVLPLAPRGTERQKAVWRAVSQITPGQTTTYGELAEQLGDANLARSVGTAIGRNPLAIVVPCHRVVGSDGSLKGYAGGLDAKSWLLDHERGQTSWPASRLSFG